MKDFLALFTETYKQWQADHASRLAAAIAYYTALSIAPLLVVTVLVVGIIFNEQSVQNQIVTEVTRSIGIAAGELVESLIDSATTFEDGILAAIIGLVTLIFGATNVFSHMREALNVIWNVDDAPQGNGIIAFIMDKVLSLGMVLVIGFLLLVSLVLSTILSAVGQYLSGFGIVLEVVSIGLSFALVTLLFVLIYKFLPNAIIQWTDAWVGGAVTAALFTLGKTFLSFYLANNSTASIYGAAGAFVLILLWIYYSAQIILFGAEFTQVFAHKRGAEIKTKSLSAEITSSVKEFINAR